MGQKSSKHIIFQIYLLPAPANDKKDPPVANQYPSRIICKALFDFDAIKENDLSFKKDALLAVTERIYNEGSNWMEAVLVQDKKVGYIPRNYITKDSGTIQLEIQENVIYNVRNGRSANEPLPETTTDKLSTVIEPTAQLKKQVKALYDFDAMDEEDIDFKEGDILEVECEKCVGWWVATNIKTNEKGDIPSNYVEEYHILHDSDAPENREEIQENVIYNVRNGRSANEPLPETTTDKLSTVIEPTAQIKKQVKALYDFDAVEKEDIDLKKGDILEVECEKIVHWWVATNIKTNEKGFIPSNYVEEYHILHDSDAPENREWFFDVNRSESKKLLLMPVNNKGSYLIRPASDGTNYALSMLCENTKKGKYINHYLLHKSSDGCVVITKKNFLNIPQLIQYYSVNDLDYEGTKLAVVCVRN